jgi:hypothetical protein
MHTDFASGSADQRKLGSGESAQRSLGTPRRIVLLLMYLLITLPVLPVFAANVQFLRPLLAVDLSVRAVPLYITALVDARLLDAGEVTHELMPLWVGLTGVMLWPLLVLSIWPAMWDSRGWRRAIVTYGIVLLLATIGAAYWVFTHLGIFF